MYFCIDMNTFFEEVLFIRKYIIFLHIFCHMKLRSILTALLFMACLQTVKAQKVVLYMADNQKFECSVSKLDSITFVGEATDDSDVHEWVDLGLPSGTLWATCNVGASKPEEYGDYFAWGETTTKGIYNWSTYKYFKGSSLTMTKYCNSSIFGTVDNKTELEPTDDAATANWGSGWQMPSYAQFNELINSSYTTTTWTTLNGKYGRKISSKSNGNSIFLPAAGYRYDASLDNAGSYGFYWSRSLNTSYSYYAYYLSFDSSNINASNYYRYYGQSVRPVRAKETRYEVIYGMLPNFDKLKELTTPTAEGTHLGKLEITTELPTDGIRCVFVKIPNSESKTVSMFTFSSALTSPLNVVPLSDYTGGSKYETPGYTTYIGTVTGNLILGSKGLGVRIIIE